MWSSSLASAIVMLGLVFGTLCQGGNAALQVGFYKEKCGSADVETIVDGIIRAWYKKDPTITPALLRMQFHDCFVNVS